MPVKATIAALAGHTIRDNHEGHYGKECQADARDVLSGVAF